MTLTNLGNVAETVTLGTVATAGLPSGVYTAQVTLLAPDGLAGLTTDLPASGAVSVAVSPATATDGPGVSASTGAGVSAVANGVGVAPSPGSSAPGGAFQAGPSTDRGSRTSSAPASTGSRRPSSSRSTRPSTLPPPGTRPTP